MQKALPSWKEAGAFLMGKFDLIPQVLQANQISTVLTSNAFHTP